MWVRSSRLQCHGSVAALRLLASRALGGQCISLVEVAHVLVYKRFLRLCFALQDKAESQCLALLLCTVEDILGRLTRHRCHETSASYTSSSSHELCDIDIRILGLVRFHRSESRGNILLQLEVFHSRVFILYGQ